MYVKFKKMHADAKIPQYMTSGSAGFDLSSVDTVSIAPRSKSNDRYRIVSSCFKWI